MSRGIIPPLHEWDKILRSCGHGAQRCCAPTKKAQEPTCDTGTRGTRTGTRKPERPIRRSAIPGREKPKSRQDAGATNPRETQDPRAKVTRGAPGRNDETGDEWLDRGSIGLADRLRRRSLQRQTQEPTLPGKEHRDAEVANEPRVGHTAGRFMGWWGDWGKLCRP